MTIFLSSKFSPFPKKHFILIFFQFNHSFIILILTYVLNGALPLKSKKWCGENDTSPSNFYFKQHINRHHNYSILSSAQIMLHQNSFFKIATKTNMQTINTVKQIQFAKVELETVATFPQL